MKPKKAGEEEEEEEDKKDNGEEKEKVEVKIDFDGIANRMLPLGVAGRIGALQAGKAGELFYLKTVNDKTSLNKYSTKDRESKELVGEANLYRVSADGKQILVQSNDKWQIFKSAAPLDKEAKTLNMKLSKFVDNAAEWQQMFREAWRFQRDFFYVTNLHGVDWDGVYAAYQPLVAHVRHASDMTYLLDNMGAETSVGHSFTSHGDLPDTPDSRTGLLGANLKATDGGFEFGRIFLGESWYPDEQSAAPFAKIPGQVQADDVLKAINGLPLDAGSNLHEALRGTVGKQTRLTIARDGRDEDANVTVVPIDDEEALRRNAWVEDNRRRVDEASGGKLAYVWVPNTAEMGFTYFNRYFFAQSQRDGVIVDERFNHGGYIAEYFIDVLRREKNGYFNNVMAPDRPVTSPRRWNLGGQGDADQRGLGLGRRHAAFHVSLLRRGPPGRQADLGRPGGYLGRAGPCGRRLHHGPAQRLLQPGRRVAGRKRGHCPGRRGRAVDPRDGCGPRPSTGESHRDRHG